MSELEGDEDPARERLGTLARQTHCETFALLRVLCCLSPLLM